VPWGDLFDRVALRYGYTYAAIARMTPDQLGNALSEHKDGGGVQVDSLAEAMELAQERRRLRGEI
jgi:hypothetical protein